MSNFSAKLSLFPVKEKTKENSPDMTGDIEIPTNLTSSLVSYLQSAEPESDWQDNPIVKLRVSTWENEMKDGRKYLKGQVQEPYKKPAEGAAPAPAPVDEELPF